MTAAGASTSAEHDTGEFTDDEDRGIPLEDIRKAQFERLEAVAPSREPLRTPRRDKSSWLPWKRSKRPQRAALGSYLPVEEEDQTQLLRRKPRSKPLDTAQVAEAVKEFSCDSKLGWGIFTFLCVACLFILVAASVTGHIPNPLSSHRPSNGTATAASTAS